jgi:hypothetical protein
VEGRKLKKIKIVDMEDIQNKRGELERVKDLQESP